MVLNVNNTIDIKVNIIFKYNIVNLRYDNTSIFVFNALTTTTMLFLCNQTIVVRNII